jgi:predicted MPP superfamily phosphohydrolase
MRKLSFAIFFTVALSVYGLINFYIILRGWQLLSLHPALRTYSLVIAIVFASAFIVGRILERFRLTWYSSVIVWIGSFWLAAMAYFLIIALGADLLRLSDYVVPWFPSYLTLHPDQARDAVVIVVVSIVFITVFLGHMNALRPRIRTLNLSVGKTVPGSKTLNIVAVSDIHLGTVIGKSRLKRIVTLVNSLNADLVLLPGDVFDEDIGPVIKENLGETLRTIRSKYGVIAITGKHEYIGGEEAACRYLNDHGINVLRDSSLRIEDICTVVGREDLSIRQFAGKKRKSLGELMKDVDTRLPVILLDHQPFHLEEAERNGVDLQLSGHTHHGQLWPFNYISQKIFEVSWGYKKKGNTHIYVSCGVGTWGPPVRTGNTPEIVNIKLSFN